jgi:hypothetical protein
MVSNPFPLVLNIIEHPKKKQKHIENIGSFHIIETIFFFRGMGLHGSHSLLQANIGHQRLTPGAGLYHPKGVDVKMRHLYTTLPWKKDLCCTLKWIIPRLNLNLPFVCDLLSDFATFSISSQISGWVRGSFLCSVVIKRPFSCFYKLSFVPTPETVPEPSWV